ncbi:MAG: antibiotic biosynthesis monooxygenase family protein [Chloroflexota bacterium]
MYVSIFRYRVKPGMEATLREHNEEWKRTIRQSAPGFISVHVYSNPRKPLEWTHVATFVDRIAEMQNANSPEQRKWYRKMVEMLDEPPQVWEGELIQEG